jgi:hypothetical protein
MKRILLLVSCAVGGCAIVSGSPSATTPTTASSSKYEVMESQPPAAQSEDMPKLAAGEVWVPGYYQPVSGTWIWHQGQVTAAKEGYRLMPPSYHEEGGKVYFTPPRWRRADLSPKPSEMAAQK